jgi:glycosyltransferase involved in cell wall biosynthesis
MGRESDGRRAVVVRTVSQGTQSMPAPYLSVVAPCYNEEESLPEFYRRVSEVCRAQGVPYEVVLINDGSRDRTWPMLREVAGQDPRVVAVNLMRNHGHQLALTAGLSVCRGERILIIDADLQDPPELLPDMMRLMDDGADVVYGQRRRRDGETAFKRATASLFYRLISSLSEVEIPRDTGDFRLLSRKVLGVFLGMPERHRFIRGMMSWIGGRQVPLPYDRDARFAGETKYPLRKMLKLAWDAVTGFSIRPLQLATKLGVAVSGAAFLMIVYSLCGWLAGHAVDGWTSLMAAVGLLGGIQLLVLGVLGEYLGRMYEQSQGRPLFMVREILNQQATEATADRHDRDRAA